MTNIKKLDASKFKRKRAEKGDTPAEALRKMADDAEKFPEEYANTILVTGPTKSPDATVYVLTGGTTFQEVVALLEVSKFAVFNNLFED